MRTSAILFALCAAVPAAAAQNWVQQGPIPVEQSLYTVSFLTADHGFVGGTDGAWMETDDGGQTWTQVSAVPRSPLFQENPFYRSMFLDPLHGWVIGNNDDAFRTVDGGATWTRMSTFPAGSYYHLDFVDAQHGWAGGNGSVVATTDGGQTWTVQTWYNQQGNVLGLDFRDSQTGLFTNSPLSSSGYAQGIWRTDDGGASWSLLRQGSFGMVRWTGPNRILAATPLGFEHSLDGGQTWQTTLRPFDLVALDRAGPTDMVALGLDGSVWASSDLGMTWTQRHPPIQYLEGAWSDVRFVNAQVGFAVGRGGFVVRTLDGGYTWTQLGSGHGASSWEDLDMATPVRGLACGPYGALVVTEDGGRTWRAGVKDANGAALAGTQDFESVDTVGASTYFTAADGFVLRSTDAGATWHDISGNLPLDYVHAVDFVDANTGFVAGQNQFFSYFASLWKTTDGGQTWTNLDPQHNLPALYDMQMLDAQEGWVCGSGQYVYRTTDGGQSWVPYDTPFTISTPRTSIAFAPEDRDVAWIAGAYGYVARTDDGGITWNLQTLPQLPSFESPLDIAVLDAQHAWIATGPDGYVYETSNGGASWTRRTIAPYVYPGLGISAVEVTDTGHLWAAGSAGRIWSAAPPDPQGIFLHRTDLHRGQSVQLAVSNAQPGETVWFAYSLAGAAPNAGPAPPALGGLVVDLLQPVVLLGSAVANLAGNVPLVLGVPAAAPLADVSLQAFAARGAGGNASVESNTQTTPILP